MEKVNLNFGETFKEAFTIGIKNAASLLGCLLLWIVTIWVPWINVGTTIAIITLPIELSKGNIISPLHIFDAKYRKYFGEVLLTQGLMILPIFLGLLFMVVPGIVLSLAWSLAIYFVIDKKIDPTKALASSNEATYGSKWIMLGVTIVIGLILILGSGIVGGLFSALFSAIFGHGTAYSILMGIIYVIVYSIAMSIGISTNASIYRQLQNNI